MQGNTSGLGRHAQVPPEVRGWNWGAFFLNWIWGIGNSTYIALLMFIPFVNLVIPFVLGAKGNEWAWRNRTWRSVEQFKAAQRRWSWAGLILFLLIPCCAITPFIAMKFSDAYRMSLEAVRTNRVVTAELGQPLKPGFFVMGSISINGSDGNATVQYSISGPKGAGEVSAYAVKHAGKWQLRQVTVQAAGNRIHVIGGHQTFTRRHTRDPAFSGSTRAVVAGKPGVRVDKVNVWGIHFTCMRKRHAAPDPGINLRSDASILFGAYSQHVAGGPIDYAIGG